MNTIKRYTAHHTTTTSTRRHSFVGIGLAAVLLLVSAPAFGQGVSYNAAPDAFVAQLQMEKGAETTLPLLAGKPALRKRMPEITYPIKAQKFQAEGQVLVEYVVNEKGRVVRSSILKSPGYGCDQEVLRVLRQARFQPALDAAGQPQKARYLAAFDFKLDS